MAMADPRAAEVFILAGLLAQPGEESAVAVAEVAEDYPWLKEAAAELAALPLSDWQVEHTRLFINGQPKTCCPPFASVYCQGRMHGEKTLLAERLFQQLSFQANADLPADYLGSLLECLAWMLEQGVGESPAARLLKDELLAPWLLPFALDLQQSSSLRIYRVLAERLPRVLD